MGLSESIQRADDAVAPRGVGRIVNEIDIQSTDQRRLIVPSHLFEHLVRSRDHAVLVDYRDSNVCFTKEGIKYLLRHQPVTTRPAASARAKYHDDDSGDEHADDRPHNVGGRERAIEYGRSKCSASGYAGGKRQDEKTEISALSNPV